MITMEVEAETATTTDTTKSLRLLIILHMQSTGVKYTGWHIGWRGSYGSQVTVFGRHRTYIRARNLEIVL